jgi:hypothetical protein
MGMLDPAMQQRLGQIQQAAPDYASYFKQLSSQSFEDANRQSARLAAQHGGAPTASTGNTGQNQGAYQGMLYDQLNKSNVDRMWNTQDQWEQNKYNKGADAYKDYFGAIANRAYNTGEEGYTSGIYNPSGGSAFNPYANSNFPKYNDSDAPAGGGGGGAGRGGAGGAGGGGGGSYGGGGGAGGGGGGYQDYPDFWGEEGYPGGPREFGGGDQGRGGYGDGSYDDPYGGGSQGGGLDSYLSEIAQSGAGTPQDSGYEYSGGYRRLKTNSQVNPWTPWSQ